MSLNQAHASKTTWIGTSSNGNWSTAANWDNGVPTLVDSAVITGGTIMTNLNVLISSNVAVRHITIDDHCILSISKLFRLEVTDAPDHAIRVEEYGSLLNFGTLDIFNSSIGISVLGNFVNDGDCTIDAAGFGISILQSGSVKNVDTLFIRNSLLALSCSALYINESIMSIQDCVDGIFTDEKSDIQNNGRINIENITGVGIKNNHLFINNGTLDFKNIGGSNAGIAISNEHISYPGVTYPGYFVNNSTVFMSDIKGNAIENWDVASFRNSGTIWVQNVLGSGLIGNSGSHFTITDDGLLILKSISATPLDIHEGGSFDVAVGGFVNIVN